MPNRIIKESCRTSRTLDALSDGAERLYWHLTTVTDDYGCFDPDARVLLCNCFPLKVETLKVKTVQGWLDELTSIAPGDDAPAVTLYRVNMRTYGMLTKWQQHQRDRSKDQHPPKPKFPSPKEGELLNAIQRVLDSPPVVAPVPVRPAPVTPDLKEAEMRFEAFWASAPDRGGKKIGRAKSRTLFMALNAQDQAQCVLAVKAYMKHCREQKRLPKDPFRFIKGQDGELWRDFIPQAPIVRAVPKPAPLPLKGEPCPPEAAEILRNLGRSMSFPGSKTS